MNNKPPAFQFYPKDWLSDQNVKSLTYEQMGWYIVLICHCWLEGSIPSNPFEVQKILQIQHTINPFSDGPTVTDEIDDLLGRCFKPHNHMVDRLVNPRVEKERRLQAERRLKLAQISALGVKARKEKSYNQPSGKPSVDGRLTSSSSSSSSSSLKKESIKKKKFLPPTLEEAKFYFQSQGEVQRAEAFFDHFETRNWIPKGYKVQMSDWRAAARNWCRNAKEFSKMPTRPPGEDEGERIKRLEKEAAPPPARFIELRDNLAKKKMV